MNKEDTERVKELLSAPKNIVIVTHKNPDGDAIGSTLALHHYLLKYKHRSTVIVPNNFPGFLKWIPGTEEVLIYDYHTEISDVRIAEADLIFTLDFNALHRSGDMETALSESSALKIMIDHHQAPDNYAKYMFSDIHMSSTCEMIYHFIDMMNDIEIIDATIATCLYVGIMTDTGSFKFDCTTSTTHHIIAQLIDKGADNSEIHNKVYDTNSYERLQLLGCALKNLKLLPEFRTAYTTLSQDELNKYNFKKGDTEGVVNYGLSIENVVLAAIFIEDKQEGLIKISLRSKGHFSVNTLSRDYFNGGGHTNAAGGKSYSSLNDTVEKFISILPSYKTALNNE
ncbi:DHH family phosphoesterase [Aestuariivivens sediminicola]|uniref:DHH family phosphoesterase n=1 Tax=Aestuariivivens sediminicola TaxID=2913560 RepID=UPI001F55ACFA|nr:bifunctional oligoribonuclease/PAP phosphatase NrnA [Aestuariivivens sediminicola]